MVGLVIIAVGLLLAVAADLYEKCREARRLEKKIRALTCDKGIHNWRRIRVQHSASSHLGLHIEHHYSCTQCGWKAIEVPKLCRACGGDNPVEARYCRHCGGVWANARSVS